MRVSPRPYDCLMRYFEQHLSASLAQCHNLALWVWPVQSPMLPPQSGGRRIALGRPTSQLDPALETLVNESACRGRNHLSCLASALTCSLAAG